MAEREIERERERPRGKLLKWAYRARRDFFMSKSRYPHSMSVSPFSFEWEGVPLNETVRRNMILLKKKN